MIDIELPDGRTVRIDTDDPQAAAAAGKKIWQNEQGAAGLNADEMRVPISDPTQPDGQMDWYEQAATPTPGGSRPEMQLFGDQVRGAKIGWQGAGRGAAELAGAPVDITTMLMNLVPLAAEGGVNMFLDDADEISLPRITNPAGGSQQIRDTASRAAEAAGMDLIDESDMSVTERGMYNINRLVTETIGGAGVGQAANAGARAGSALQRYTKPFANPTAGSMGVDVAAGAGSGAALTAAQEFTDNPIAEFVAMLAGGLGGGRAAQVARSPLHVGNFVERSLPDPDVPGVSRRTADRTAKLVQENVSGNREEAAERIGELANTARQNDDPTPTAGIASGDIGLTSMERGARGRDAVPFLESDKKLQDAAQEKVTGLRDPNAEPRAAQRFVDEDAEARRQEAQAPIEPAREELAQTRAEGASRVGRAQLSREQTLAEQDRRISETSEQRRAAEEAEKAVGGEVQGRLGSEGAASERLAEAVGTAKQADESKKGALYSEAEELGKTSDMTRQSTDLAEDARAIRGDISRLAQNDNALANILDDLDRLDPQDAKAVDSGVLGPDGQPIMKPAEREPVMASDLIAMLPRISDARNAATRAKRGDVVKRLDRVSEGIRAHLEAYAGAGDAAAQKWMEAEGFFKEDFAPKYREGVGGALDQAERSRQPVPPTAVASKLLKPGPGGKEAAADMKRILAGSEGEQAGMQAARDYVLADLARVVGNDGKINPNRLRIWKANREDMLEQVPGLYREVDGLLNDVVNKRNATGKLQQDLERAVAERKGTAERTKREIKDIERDSALSEKVKQERIAALEREAVRVEREIQKDATSILLGTDPAIAAKEVFTKGRDPEKAMADIVAKLSKDPEALAGWKRAVTDHLIDRVTGTNTALTGGADGPVKLAQLKKFFDDNERTLAKMYSPAEMNALRRAHKVLEPLGNLQRSAVPGSQTAYNQRAMDELEGAFLFTHGAVTAGMIMKRIKTVLNLLGRQDKVDDLVDRFWFDPELAQHLLTRNPKTIESAPWNKKLTRLLAVGEAARETIDEDAESEEIPD